jgi:hypothetical protein
MPLKIKYFSKIIQIKCMLISLEMDLLDVEEIYSIIYNYRQNALF